MDFRGGRDGIRCLIEIGCLRKVVFIPVLGTENLLGAELLVQVKIILLNCVSYYYN